MALGLGSNLIVRDGGVAGRGGAAGQGVRASRRRGTMRRTHRPAAEERVGHSRVLEHGARCNGIAGLEFLRSIPGTVGGFVRMNGGAYGRETKDILVACVVVMRDGAAEALTADQLNYSYRHSELPADAIVVEATFTGVPSEPTAIQAEMDRIAGEREASQPLRSKTGGSTFKNPEGDKAWRLVDAAGCRGLTIGGAQVSEKHCNFLLNTGDATSADIEALGEEVRVLVKAQSGMTLEWEIQRVGLQ